jgi:hypothetical protein
MKRNPDGTYRNARHPIIISDRIIVAGWVSAEILACKRKGLSMAAISNHISRVGQGLEQHCLPFPMESPSRPITASVKVQSTRVITRLWTGSPRSMRK